MRDQRYLGNSDIQVTPVSMGCWPISGMTSLEVNDDDSIKTLHAAIDAGINFFDTAFCYGINGESERLIAQVIDGRRDRCVVASKGGIHWDASGDRKIDGRGETLTRQCEESLLRLGTDYLDVLYLHAPDPAIEIEESAGALKRLLDSGKTRAIGVSNVSVEQLAVFQKVCPVSVVQPPYNMLQREIESELVPWCRENSVSLAVYWPLMKGLLAGKLARDHQFQPGDGRAKYPMFQGEQWERNQDFVDDLRVIAESIECTVSQLVIAWTIVQPGITTAICGAKRDYQITESAGAMNLFLTDEVQSQIAAALSKRGEPITRSAV